MFVTLLLFVILLVIIDLGWLGLRMGYHKALFASVQGSPLSLRYVPAALVYVLFAVALWHVAVKPSTSVQQAAMQGFLTGLVMYGFYDMTNLATLTRWTWEMAVSDSLWGGVAGAIGSALAYRYLKK